MAENHASQSELQRDTLNREMMEQQQRTLNSRQNMQTAEFHRERTTSPSNYPHLNTNMQSYEIGSLSLTSNGEPSKDYDQAEINQNNSITH